MLAVEPSIDWIDCQARKDVMNFYQFDPIASHGIDVGAARRNPNIVPVRFRDIIKPEHYKRFAGSFSASISSSSWPMSGPMPTTSS